MAGRNLLLVEDDQVLQELYLERFQIAGFNVIQAFDGEEALEMLKKHPNTNMILLDIMLPKLSGFEVLERVRNQPALKDLPIIVVSALADLEDHERAIKLGATDYITKGEMLPGGIIDKIKQLLTDVPTTSYE